MSHTDDAPPAPTAAPTSAATSAPTAAPAGTAAKTAPGTSADGSAAPAPLLQMLQLPTLPGIDGDVPVCGPDGCAVPPLPQS